MLVENNPVFASLTVYTTKLFCCEPFSLDYFSLTICLVLLKQQLLEMACFLHMVYLFVYLVCLMLLFKVANIAKNAQFCL